MGININYKKNGGDINIYINSISGNNYTRCALVCARVRAYPPPFVMCERVRVVSECRSLGVLVSSDGVGLPSRCPDVGAWLGRSFLAGEVVARCPFVVARVARLPSVALWRRVWPRVVFFCRCRLVGRLVSKSRLWARFRPCFRPSSCRRVALTLGGVALPYFSACAWGRIYLNPPTFKFSS